METNLHHHHGHDHHHEEEEMELVTLKVEGMTCTNCALGLTKTLEKKGLHHVNSDFASGEVTFELVEEQHIPMEEIIDSIQKLGYKVIDKKKKETSKKLFTLERKFLISLVFSIPLVAHMFLPFAILHNTWFQLALCIPVFLIGLAHFGKSALSSLKAGVANMDVLIIIGSSAAFLYSLIGSIIYLGTPEIHNYLFYETAATIITLVLLGNVLEHRSVNQTTSAIKELTKMQEVNAIKIISENGKESHVEIKFQDIKINDILLVNTGDKVPVDGEITWGHGVVDESMITGESVPVEKKLNEKVIGGTILINGNMKVKAEQVGKETVLSKIIEMVKKAQQQKPEIQKLGDKVSAIFVPVVLIISALTFIFWYFIADASLNKALMTSIAVLVISCPCAMGLATPTAVIVGLGRAAKNGILIKGGSTIELLAKVKSVFFDKTGTLTTGDFKIKNITILNSTPIQEIKNILFSLEQHSAHPIAKSIVKELSTEAQSIEFSHIEETKGSGIKGIDKEGHHYLACSYSTVKHLVTGENSFNIYLLKDNEAIAGIDLQDDIKESAGELVETLNQKNIETILISGDKEEKCIEVGKALNIKQIFSEQLPQQKLAIISNFEKKGITAMVGDGINDAPALAKADVGISLSNATQVAIQSAQVILLNKNDMSKVNYALLIGKHTLITIKQNLFWAFFYNALAIPIAAAGLLNPMVAALAMAFSDVIVVGNSLRLKSKKID